MTFAKNVHVKCGFFTCKTMWTHLQLIITGQYLEMLRKISYLALNLDPKGVQIDCKSQVLTLSDINNLTLFLSLYIPTFKTKSWILWFFLIFFGGGALGPEKCHIPWRRKKQKYCLQLTPNLYYIFWNYYDN